MLSLDADALLDAARVGFAGLAVPPPLQEAALGHLARWLTEPPFASYRYQLAALVEARRWDLLLDSFYQVLPFGTGGRRGQVGVGPNRFNAWTLAASVQGHAAWLRRTRGDDSLSVVIAYDVRVFRDLSGQLAGGVPNPLDGLSSRDFAEIAAEVYAAAGIAVYLPAIGCYLSTPELSFAIRHLGADGGLNISASHNPPDDNGGKFYNASGSQEVPPRDEEMASEVANVGHIDRMPLDRARAAGLVRELGADLHEAYVQCNLALALRPAARSARVVFTPLHGLGRNTVLPVLQRAGFAVSVEPSQAAYDGAFPNVPFRAPNPEVPRSMGAAVATAEAAGADLVMACDPDADRLGLVVRHPAAPAEGVWRFVSGNEIAALVCHAALSAARRPRPLVLTTEVTSRLLTRVARAGGAAVVNHLLVGFKYIGDALEQIDSHGQYAGRAATLDDFLLGAEESHGVLVTPSLRDKDAAGGALLLAELASEAREQGRTLIDVLEELWRAVGYVRNELVSTVMRGAEGRARIQAAQRSLREDPPREIGGRPVTASFDRLDPAGLFGPIRSETDRASRDVLVWELGEDERIVLRPSGTEPKNKIYVEVAGRPGAELATEIPRVNAEARRLARAFSSLMLSRVEVTLPDWALAISDLVSVEQKVQFAEEILPALLTRIRQGEPELGRWLDRALAGFGRDARGLVAEGVRAWQASQPEQDEGLSSALAGLFAGW